MTERAPRMSLIGAVGDNGVIGHEGDMPWRLSSDLRFFKRTTLGKPVVMGRKTLASIGKPLPGRHNLVVSRDPGYAVEGATVHPSLEAAIAAARDIALREGLDEYFIGGGGTLYAATIDRADRLYVTRVHASPDGDTHFPAIDPAVWRRVSSEPMVRTERDSADATFEVWERI
ncbi:dihydrofolate reductase [Oryzibacter oryziterrae]|uniref:dihydrofolate reductase n=1 Tax=Oryzibacter oryziterrae TaxID=2766474 RepID=UPI001F251589|nr:dihydrofolate reductase [Oryzibacter oryziterrae]